MIPTVKYYNKDVTKLLGICKDKVSRWSQSKIVIPVKDGSGYRGQREYGKKNLLEFAICRQLDLVGIGPRYMKKIMEVLRNQNNLEFLFGLPWEWIFPADGKFFIVIQAGKDGFPQVEIVECDSELLNVRTLGLMRLATMYCIDIGSLMSAINSELKQ